MIFFQTKGLLHGIISLLEDEVKIKSTSASNFFQKLKNNYANHPKFGLPIARESCFLIRHYSKDVSYSSVSNSISLKLDKIHYLSILCFTGVFCGKEY